jgi:cytochrome c-type biogenesis protein CcmF
VPGPNYTAARGLVVVTREGREIAQMHPEKRVYRVQNNPMTEADINVGLTRDLYVSLGQATEGDAWIVRIYYKPFVSWIWGGCALVRLAGSCSSSALRAASARRRTW